MGIKNWEDGTYDIVVALVPWYHADWTLEMQDEFSVEAGRFVQVCISGQFGCGGDSNEGKFQHMHHSLRIVGYVDDAIIDDCDMTNDPHAHHFELYEQVSFFTEKDFERVMKDIVVHRTDVSIEEARQIEERWDQGLPFPGP